MASIAGSTEILRRPEDVFQYLTDPSRLHEWQEGVVSAQHNPPIIEGSRIVVTRRIGRMQRAMTMEVTELKPPHSWTVRGVDGPVRGHVRGTVEPMDYGVRSRVTIEADFEGRGAGKLLVPLMVRKQVESELPQNLENLKARLESTAAAE